MERLGKLKRTIHKTCPDCGKKSLQIRVVTEEIKCKGEDEEKPELKDAILEEEVIPKTREVEYLYCPFCEYEEKYTEKKVRKHINQREEEEALWTSPPTKNYGNNYKKKSNSSSTGLPKESRRTWRKG